jgi:phytoene synthase
MDAVVEHSRELIEKGSKSFAGAARLFDADTRDSAYMLYAWCRHADDEIDGQDLGHAPAVMPLQPAEERLAILRSKTLRALDGEAAVDDPVFRALARVIAKHDIPRRHPLELIEGFEMDVAGTTYTSLDETCRYCYHVAGVVGVMMAMIMGVRERETLNRASDLGIAFQLTNIARDVITDAEGGRVYLPADWLRAEGVDATPGAVADRDNRAAVFRVTERLLDDAERYYVSARHGLPALPVRAAWAIATARRVYRDIGSVVRTRKAAAWDERAVVSRTRKMVSVAYAGLSISRAHLAGAMGSAPPRSGLWTAPDLGEAA